MGPGEGIIVMAEALRRTEWSASDGARPIGWLAKLGQASVVRVSMMIWFAGAYQLDCFRQRKAISFLTHINLADNVTNQQIRQKSWEL